MSSPSEACDLNRWVKVHQPVGPPMIVPARYTYDDDDSQTCEQCGLPCDYEALGWGGDTYCSTRCVSDAVAESTQDACELFDELLD